MIDLTNYTDATEALTYAFSSPSRWLAEAVNNTKNSSKDPSLEHDSVILKNMLIVYGNGLLMLLVFFSWARIRFPKPFTVRAWTPHPEIRSPLAKNQHGYLHWIWVLNTMIAEDEILEHCGLDALSFLRALRMGAKISLVGTVNAIWLIPLYYTAQGSESSLKATNTTIDNVVRLTVSNLPNQSPRFLGTVIACYIMVFSTMFFILEEFAWFTEKRHKFLRLQRPRNYTVYVRNIPPEYRSNELLAQFFRQCFSDGAVLDARLKVSASNLGKFVSRRNTVLSKLEYALVEEQVTGSAPMHMEGMVGVGGYLVNSIETYAEELRRLNIEIKARIEAIEQKLVVRESHADRFIDFRSEHGIQPSELFSILESDNGNVDSESSDSEGNDHVDDTDEVNGGSFRAASKVQFSQTPADETLGRVRLQRQSERSSATRKNSLDSSDEDNEFQGQMPPRNERLDGLRNNLRELERGINDMKRPVNVRGMRNLDSFQRRGSTGSVEGFERRGSMNGGLERRGSMNGGLERRGSMNGGLEWRGSMNGGLERRGSMNGGSERRGSMNSSGDNFERRRSFRGSGAGRGGNLDGEGPVRQGSGRNLMGELTRQGSGRNLMGELTRQGSGRNLMGELTRQGSGRNLMGERQNSARNLMSPGALYFDDTPYGKDIDVVEQCSVSDILTTTSEVLESKPVEPFRSSISMRATRVSRRATGVASNMALAANMVAQNAATKSVRMAGKAKKKVGYAANVGGRIMGTAGGFAVKGGAAVANTALNIVAGNEDGTCFSAGFVSFTNLTDTNAALQLIHDAAPHNMEVLPAPEPNDVFWINVARPHNDLLLGKLFAIAATMAFCIFWTIPMTAIQSLSTVEELKKEYPFLRRAVESYGIVEPMLEQLAPLLLIFFNSVVLPGILKALSMFEGPVSGSVVEASTFSKQAVFMIIQTFFVSAITGSALADNWRSAITDPVKLIEVLGEELPQMSTYFMQIAFVRTVVYVGNENLRVVAFSMAFARRFIGPQLTKEQRQKSYLGINPLAVPLEFELSFNMSQICVLYFVILLVYQPLAPLTSFIIGFCFRVSRTAYLHQFIYIYPKTRDSGGLIWTSFIKIVLAIMLIAEVVVLGLCGLNEARTAFPFMFPLIAITVVFNAYVRERHFRVTEVLPTRECMKYDGEHGMNMNMDFVHRAYVQEEMREKEIFPEGMSKERLVMYGLKTYDEVMDKNFSEKNTANREHNEETAEDDYFSDGEDNLSLEEGKDIEEPEDNRWFLTKLVFGNEFRK